MGTVVITGVAQGLGRALAEEFIAQGHRVVGCDVAGEAIALLQQRHGSPHSFATVDITAAAQVDRWVAAAIADSPPDLLINNAGAMHPLGSLWEISAEMCDRTLAVNLGGTVNVLRAVLPGMVAQAQGMIVNISARWGRVGAAGAAPFCASKWAIEGLTQALAQELPAGMGAVTLSPGAVHTQALATIHGADKASTYIDPQTWAVQAVPYLLGLSPELSGQALTFTALRSLEGSAQ
jgi:NAD(P)-dependent dehydrogenase (short-subunit alcohol dehydrogenase family)